MSAAVARPIVVMGVSGSGKSTVGALLAERLGMPFVDADDLHDAVAKATMAAGVALSDDDRWPWLDRVGARLALEPHPVVACSALRRAYRDRLRAAAPGMFVAHLDVDERTTIARASERSHEFMPPSLVSSQHATLESLASDERGIVLDGRSALRSIVEAAQHAFRSSAESPSGPRVDHEQRRREGA